MCTHLRHPTDEKLRLFDISSNNNLPVVPLKHIIDHEPYLQCCRGYHSPAIMIESLEGFIFNKVRVRGG